MAVLKTTSPTVWPAAPTELPTKAVPSASAKMAWGLVCDDPCKDKSTGFSEFMRLSQALNDTLGRFQRFSCFFEEFCFVALGFGRV